MSRKKLLLTAILIIGLFCVSTYALVFRRQRLSGPAISPFTPWFANSLELFTPTKEFLEITNLDQVFSTTSVNESDPQQSDLVTLMVTGDVLLAREVNRNIQARRDPTWPFLNAASELQKPDLTLINLETPLIPDCP